MEEGSDVLSFSPVLTGDGQEEPSLPQAVLTGERMGVQYKAEGAASQVLTGETDKKTGSQVYMSRRS